jgi:hypothetical protein
MAIIATGVMTLFYLATYHPELVPVPFDLPKILREAPRDRHTYGGTALGLIYGSLALLAFIFAAALGIRRRNRLWRIGRVRLWLRAHVWFSILTIPLVAFHCGFTTGGVHTTWLMLLYGFVMATGFFGLAMQHFMPRIMKDRLPQEVVFEQIPHIRGLLVAAAEELRKSLAAAMEPAPAAVAAAPVAEPAEPVPEAEPDTSAGIIAEFMDDECLPYLRKRRGDRHRLGDQKTSDDLFRLLKLHATAQYVQPLIDMQQWCDDRRMMDLQTKLHHWLHGWLLLHVPASFALIVWTAWHAWIEIQFL